VFVCVRADVCKSSASSDSLSCTSIIHIHRNIHPHYETAHDFRGGRLESELQESVSSDAPINIVAEGKRLNMVRVELCEGWGSAQYPSTHVASSQLFPPASLPYPRGLISGFYASNLYLTIAGDSCGKFKHHRLLYRC